MGQTQEQMRKRLIISRSYLSELENGREPSMRLVAAVARMEKDEMSTGRVHKVDEAQSLFDAPPKQPRKPMVADRRLPGDGTPSTRADCEAYFKHLMARADAGGNPNAFPTIYHGLLINFEIDEWDDYEAPNLEE